MNTERQNWNNTRGVIRFALCFKYYKNDAQIQLSSSTNRENYLHGKKFGKYPLKIFIFNENNWHLYFVYVFTKSCVHLQIKWLASGTSSHSGRGCYVFLNTPSAHEELILGSSMVWTQVSELGDDFFWFKLSHWFAKHHRQIIWSLCFQFVMIDHWKKQEKNQLRALVKNQR